MITSIRLNNFKNFLNEKLGIGSFTVIVGANASGKSNVRDAFRLLHGVGRGYAFAEIIGGKFGGGGQKEWDQIRGGPDAITRRGASSFGLEVELNLQKERAVYFLEIARENSKPAGFRLVEESLRIQDRMVFHKTRDEDGRVVMSDGGRTHIEQHKPALTQLFAMTAGRDILRKRIQKIIDAFDNMRFFHFSPDILKQPSYPSLTTLGDSGENLPTVLNEICCDDERRMVLREWISELTPMDVKDFAFEDDPTGKIHLVIRETNGAAVSADSASDGTLRFLAMLAVFLESDPAQLCFFEEIESGIHPARLWLLIELIERQAEKRGMQVVTTTHSPEALAMMSDSTFENASVVCRRPDAPPSVIRPVSGLPNAAELRETQGLGRLLGNGWMETAIAFTENDDEMGSADG